MTAGVMDYGAFIERKSQLDGDSGFDPGALPDWMFPFQSDLTSWALRKGRAALWEDCGLGKSPQELVWADRVMRHTNRPVLIATPLAVNYQMIREGEKFGIDVRRSDDGTPRPGVNVTNYERLHMFNPLDFGGMVCDESSAIKAFDGKRRRVVTDMMRKMEYRLLATATAAPNDFIELGTSSEALGYLGHMDMLNRFFKNDNNTSDTKGRWKGVGAPKMYRQQQWRLKGHAEEHFWRWVASWARALRKPSDLGYDDTDFILPPLIQREHLVEARTTRPGMLFDLPAKGLWEEREEARRTIAERCDMAAALVNGTGQPAIVWCHLNDEGDLLERLIPDAVQVAGADSDQTKEDRLIAFATGKARVLVTKFRIAGWGLNLQHCAHMTMFPSHSFEGYYQSVRRCWRFGQQRPVTVDIVTTEGGQGVMENLQRKQEQADVMFTRLVRYMHDALAVARQSEYHVVPVLPAWLQEAVR